MAEDHDFRNARRCVRSTGDGQRLCERRGAPQVVASRAGHLTGGHEVGLLEFPQDEREHGFANDRGVRFGDRGTKLWQRAALHANITDFAQRDVAIRLHGQRLIELRHERKTQFEDIRGRDAIAPASPRLPFIGGRSGGRSGRRGRPGRFRGLRWRCLRWWHRGCHLSRRL
jgi:hypothetical protein